jgi:hypothetical protein
VTRTLSIVVFLAIGGWAVGLGCRPESEVPTAAEVLTLAMRSTTGRVLTMASWLWVGWHFFCR